MKIKRILETPEELWDILVHEDVVLEINIPNLGDMDFNLKPSSGFSANGLSSRDVCNAIEKMLHDLGAVVHIK
jgi:hypothetical protein